MNEPSNSLYSALWRWHAIAGLVVAPILLIAAITGGIYLYHWEVDRLLAPKVFAPPSGTQRASLDTQVAVARVLVPDAMPVKLTIAPTWDLPSELLLRRHDGELTTVVIDPASGEARGAFAEDSRLTTMARQLHGNLYAGTTGRIILELGASWGLLLVISGIFLWWPRGGRSLGSALRPRLANAAGRWRELHSVIGVWLALPLVMLILTGLPWTRVWGGLLEKLGSVTNMGFPTEVFWWRPISSHPSLTTQLGPQAVWDAVNNRSYLGQVELHFPRKDGEAWLVRSAMGHAAGDGRYTFVDPVDGTVLKEFSAADGIGAIGRLTDLGVSLHMGLLFGEPNRLLSLAGVLAVLVAVVSGPILWWRRRPSRDGWFPPSVPLSAVPWAAWLVIIPLMILLPVAGISAVVALAAAWLFARLRRK
jgi:uncharacterized iron-regulated membrane protein